MSDRDRLMELLNKADDICDRTLDCDTCKYLLSGSCKKALIVDHILADGWIRLPCKVGDYVLWDNGLKDNKPKMLEVKGFHYNPADLGLRYILEDCDPIISHSAIVGIVPKEEAERALKEREQGDVREKLVELQLKADIEDEISENTTQHREYIADLMIAHGVTVQECGEWVYDHWCEFKCSMCGEFSSSKPYKGKENYCSNCGAKMMPQPSKGE